MSSRRFCCISWAVSVALAAAWGAAPVARAGGPPNDDCAAAIPVAVGLTPFSTIGATTDGPMPLSCGAGNFIGADVWYLFTAPAAGLAEWSFCSQTTLDTILEVYDAGGGGCAGPALLCLDDSCGSQTTALWPVAPGATYLLRLGGFEGQTGAGTFTLSLLLPCPLSPPAGAGAEGEPCSYLPDSVNGGCNSSPPRYGSIACGSAVRGSAWAFNDLRDTDWYRFSLPGCRSVRLEGMAQFPLRLILVNSNCGSIQILASSSGDRCELVAAQAVLPAGTYIAWVGPRDFTGAPCGSGFNDYWVRLDCTPAIPIANDQCAAATLVGAGTHPFDNAACASNDHFGSCGFAELAPDVWFRYLPSQPASAVIFTCAQTPLDTVLTVLDECNGTEIRCVDDSCDLQTELTICNLVPGEDYLIRIAGFNGAIGSGTFTITEIPPIPNDACQGALALSVPGSATGTTIGACAEPVTCPCGPGDASASLWYRFLGTGRTVTISLCDSPFPFDTALAVYTGDCAMLQCAATDDDGCSGGVGVPSRVSVCTSLGQPYLLRVSGFANARGEFQLDLLDTPAPCADPIGPCTLDCASATEEEGEACGDDLNGGCNTNPPAYRDIASTCTIRATTWAFGALRDTDWYRVSLPAGGDLTARVRGNTDLAIFLLRTSCPPESADFLSLGEFRPCPGGSPCGIVTATGLEPGDYSIFVAPGTLAGPIFDGSPCGSGLNDYCLIVHSSSLAPCARCCDTSGDGLLNSQDFFDFLACFFAPACPPADFNADGAVNSQDFFDFLACFFSPPPRCP